MEMEWIIHHRSRKIPQILFFNDRWSQHSATILASLHLGE